MFNCNLSSYWMMSVFIDYGQFGILYSYCFCYMHITDIEVLKKETLRVLSNIDLFLLNVVLVCRIHDIAQILVDHIHPRLA